MRRALVTGASRGIGLAVARALLDDGWHVAGLARTRPAIVHPAFAWLEADLAEPPCRHADLGADIDAVVHCAAVRPYGALDADPEAWAHAIRVNLLGAYHVARLALPGLRASEDGRLLLFSGGGAFGPAPGYSAYAASKAGVVALAETLAAEEAGRVAVNCVAPGFVATGIHRGTPEAGRPDDGAALSRVVACVRHLLGPATRGLTGRTISAVHDDWQALSAETVPAVMAGAMGTRDRHKIALRAAVPA